jgi:hypothetical protein
MHQQQGNGGILLTPQQEQWLAVQRLISGATLTSRPKPPSGRGRRALFNIVTSDAFEAAVMVLIILNMLVLALVHADMSTAWTEAMSVGNAVFTLLFLAEALLKATALGPRAYFTVSTGDKCEQAESLAALHMRSPVAIARTLPVPLA